MSAYVLLERMAVEPRILIFHKTESLLILQKDPIDYSQKEEALIEPRPIRNAEVSDRHETVEETDQGYTYSQRELRLHRGDARQRRMDEAAAQVVRRAPIC